MAQDSRGDKKVEVFDTMKERGEKSNTDSLSQQSNWGLDSESTVSLSFKYTLEKPGISAATTSTQNECILHFYTNTEQFPSLKMCFHYLGLTDNFHLKVI